MAGTQHCLNKRSYRIRTAARVGARSARRIGLAIVVGVSAAALIVGPIVIGWHQRRHLGPDIALQHWGWNDDLPGNITVAALAVAALTAISSWGWVRNRWTLACIAVSLVVGALAQLASTTCFQSPGIAACGICCPCSYG